MAKKSAAKKASAAVTETPDSDIKKPSVEVPVEPKPLTKAQERAKMSADERRITDLQAQVSMMMMDATRMRKELKSATLQYGIFQTLAETMQTSVIPLDPLPDARERLTPKLVTEHLVMHLSDMHADEIVESHMVGGLEKFDFGVALCRAEKYVDTVIKFTQETMSNYQFDKLTILNYGDQSSGEIHGSVSRSAYGNQFRNCLAIGQLQALMVRDLAPYFKEINIICLPGNHGRRTITKEYNGPWNNWDYLIYEIGKLHSANLKNVRWHIPECFSIVTEIEGHAFYIAHGDDIKSWNSIPFYGLERKTRRLVALHHAMSQDKLKYFVFGHFHMLSSMSDLNGETIINGAWPATNPYGYESFSGYREPQQLLHGVHPDYGITWRLNVKLKDAKREALGPQRYSVLLADKEF